jgi:hypothetical protein
MTQTHISNQPLRLTVVYEDAGDGWVMPPFLRHRGCSPKAPPWSMHGP